MKKLVCLLMFGLLLSCPNDDNNYRIDYLEVINSTEEDIYIYRRGEPVLYNEPPTDNQLIEANSNETYGERFRSFLSDGSTTHIWLLDRNVVDNNPWEEVVENDMYLVRYDLTLQDLEAMNWVIDYTGE